MQRAAQPTSTNTRSRPCHHEGQRRLCRLGAPCRVLRHGTHGLANNKMAGFKADYSNWEATVSRRKLGHRFEFGESAAVLGMLNAPHSHVVPCRRKGFHNLDGPCRFTGDGGRSGLDVWAQPWARPLRWGTDSDPMASYQCLVGCSSVRRRIRRSQRTGSDGRRCIATRWISRALVPTTGLMAHWKDRRRLVRARAYFRGQRPHEGLRCQHLV